MGVGKINDGMDDVADGLRHFHLWWLLAWRDVKSGNVRTRLGVLWHVITFFVVAAGISTLYAEILRQPKELYVPYISAGLLIWNFISAPFSEGLTVLSRDAGIITQIRTPLTLYVFRFVCKYALILCFNGIGYFLVLLSFGIVPSPHPLPLAFALALLLVSASAATVILSIASVFHTWLTSLLPSVMRLVFFATPVLWMSGMLTDSPQGSAWTSRGLHTATVLLNPLYHYLEVFRGSLVGYPVEIWSWAVVGSISSVLGIAAVMIISRIKTKVLVYL